MGRDGKDQMKDKDKAVLAMAAQHLLRDEGLRIVRGGSGKKTRLMHHTADQRNSKAAAGDKAVLIGFRHLKFSDFSIKAPGAYPPSLFGTT